MSTKSLEPEMLRDEIKGAVRELEIIRKRLEIALGGEEQTDSVFLQYLFGVMSLYLNEFAGRARSKADESKAKEQASVR